MMRNWFYLPFVFTLLSCTAQNTPSELHLSVISDLHVSVKADSREIFDSAMVRISQQHPDVLLVTGDLTDRGDSTSHFYVASAFGQLEAAGTRVFVIPGNHDLYGTCASPADFSRYYHAYGYDEAVLRDPGSLSYLAYLRHDLALLCLDSTRPQDKQQRHSDGGLTQQTLAWATEAAQQAQQSGHRVLAMMHHPVMEHFDHQAVLAENYVANTDSTYYPALSEVQRQLIEQDVKVMFTGHFHIQSIQQVTTEAGSLYDVSTGSLANFPSPIRWATLTPTDTLCITSEQLCVHRDHQLARNEELADVFLHRGVKKVFPKLEKMRKKVPAPMRLILRLPKTEQQLQSDFELYFRPVILGAYNAMASGDEDLQDPDAHYRACYEALNTYLLYIGRGNKMMARLLLGQLTKAESQTDRYLKQADEVLRSILYNYRDTPANVVSDNTLTLSLQSQAAPLPAHDVMQPHIDETDLVLPAVIDEVLQEGY